MYVTRTLEKPFLAAASQFPVMLVTGARQVGKTTILKRLRESERSYISLDDPRVLELARADPALFMQRFPGPVLIDEIQYAPGLLPYIKLAVDQNWEPGRFWLTGSQQFHLMHKVSESLAGRIGIVRLLGLSRREQDGADANLGPFLPTPETLAVRMADAPGLPVLELYERIWRGSFPGLALDPKLDRDLFFSSYVQTYLQRDVRDLARVGDEMAFLRFIRACAARTAQLLNLAELARDAGVAPNTAKSWLSILEASGVVYLLEPFHSSVTKRLVKAPKLYYLDTGLCSWLTEWTTPETLEAGAASGAILESWILTELLKSWWHRGRRTPFYFYRDKDQKEIDLLIVQDNSVYPLEFKKSASPGRDAVRHFKTLDKLGMRVMPGGVISLAESSLPLAEGHVTVPVGAL
ncbi:MAG: ATP-binding protein [Longimicrobiales bacterium]|nr:ATP-binding protein [Longimicrobiales bacterium]